MGKRTKKSILNAEVGLLFYFISSIIAFFSRKIFLDNLGADFIGLTGTLQSILGFLNLSELGIGLSISYFLFKPLATNDKVTINEILSLLGYLYKKIGYFIIIGGLIVSFFFPLLYDNTDMPIGLVFFAFYSFLFSNAIGYLINYRQVLLDADQKLYLVNAYFNSFSIIKSLIQILLAYYYKNLYFWVAIELVFSIIQCVVLNWKINKEYPWLSTDKNKGRFLIKKYPDVLIKTKQILIHQIKDFLLTKSDEILIFAFVSLKMVAYYGNYIMIISKSSSLIISFFAGTGTGIGNLVAESSKPHILSVFWQLSTLRFFATGILIYCLSFLINPFIEWWLGADYLLSDMVLFLLLLNLFIMQTRSINDMFNHSYGLYGDTWAAWAELIINITITIVTAIKWGIIGILLGKIVSLFIIVVIWKPYYLFNKGFNMSIWTYWKKTIRLYIAFLCGFSYIAFSIYILKLSPLANLSSMMMFSLSTLLPATLLFALALYILIPESKALINRIPFINIRNKK